MRTEQRHLFYIERDDKYGGFDFGANGTVFDMSFDEFNSFKLMLLAGLYQMEDSWRRQKI